jgi:DNA modification methylase
MVEPYYQDDHCTIYHGDCREILPTLCDDDGWFMFDCIVTDPPYGIGVQTNYRDRQRGALAVCNNYAPIHGDDEPFDPLWLILMGKPTVLFGANHYADTLPPSPSWIVWDKLDGLKSGRDVGFNDQADVELVWTNIGGPARLMSQRWMGAMKSGREAGDRRVHPTQKPVELMARIVGMTDGTVADPFMGSGTTLRAAKDLGRKAIGIEIEERYCEIAAKRLAQEVLPL